MTNTTDQAPIEGVRFDSNGLLPCVLQDARTGDVLTLAFMNAESFRQTLETGLVTFYSRSRKQLWVKGETSGNIMRVAELLLDCDGDALVAKVIPEGPACHTGDKHCFFQPVFKNKDVLAEIENAEAPVLSWGARLGDLMDNVRSLLQDRKTRLPEGSYSTYLFSKGLDKILKKLGEESTEVIIAAKGNNRTELSEELCDLLFHMLVLMVEKEVSLEDIRRVMDARHHGDEAATPGGQATEVKVSRPEGCEALEQQLLNQLPPELHRDVTRALEVMYRAHAGQTREEGLPYALHPLQVALIAVEEVKLREREHVLAALLHDVLEDDMATTPAELAEKFGDDAASAVVLLTKMYKRDGTPKDLGLQRYYQGLRGAPGWVKAIKLCDRVHNLRTLGETSRTPEQIQHYLKDTRANLLPLAASSMDQALLRAGELLLKELYK